MAHREVIHTPNAPAAIGSYSQAIKVGNTVYLSGQIPLDPDTLREVEGDELVQIRQAFNNLDAVIKAAGGTLNDLVKLNVYLVDLAHFAKVNEVMKERFTEPFPARAAIGVASLPRGAIVEVDGILVLPE